MFSTIATLLVTATLLSAWTTALPTIESPVTGGLVPEGGEGQVNGSIDIESTQGLIPEDDTWGPWSDEWSQCSRSCGGGVSYQDRKCILSRPGLRPNCVGPDRNYGSCNIQDCPEGSQDFRHEQCSKYNTEPFQGNLYTWVPYLGAENKCELNCMPKGKNFYYRISKQVIDGTPCESDKLDVCVNGECMKVGCDNMLGSDAKEDMCRECNGDGSSCKVVKGDFKRRKLPFGYNDILVLPAGAMNINITEVKPSNNFLALRNANGQYYINGNFSIDFPQPFQVAGTIVYYERDLNSPSYGSEVIHALGPISEPLFVVLVTQERNYGISHSYAVPSGSEGAKPDTYRWVLERFTECTRTCGGGYQLRNVWCARTRDYEASPEYLCDPTLKPAANHSCNMISCPPSWSEGEWSPCSTSCGTGQQVRLVYCEQVMHGVRAEIIDDSFCQTGSLGDKPEYQQECVSVVCPEWKSGNWSQCSSTCGRGVQTRSVVCSSDEVLGDSSCPADTQPDSRVECDLGPCENVDWLVSEWTDCSQRCGEGVQTRQLYCVGPSGTIYSEDVCNANLRPDSTQQCSSMLACPPMWHASRWTECSTDCGDGVRIRNVFCAHLVDGEWKTASDSVCNATIKLPTSEVCSNGRCVESSWFTGPWGKCSVNCGGGSKSRQLMCFGDGLSLDGSACDMSSQPIEQDSCNTHPCDGGEGGCATTAYGCCSDQTTPATGPNQEGCNQSSTDAPTESPTSFPTCADTAFGCCANDIDAASGPEGQGCEEGEPLETCELAQDTGPCFAYGIKWFFDIYYQRCTQFWYGGCGGNVNRFDSELECQAVCTIQQDPMAQEEICALAMEVGPCKASIDSFFYNTESGECEAFIYGGCHGNRNKFRTKEECDIKCGTMNKDPCSLQQDQGNCYETQVRWFYDAYSNQCEQFNYTGCLGNPNRFEDAASCEDKCVLVDRVPVIQETVGVIVDVCGLPSDAGPCEDSIAYWAYNKDLNACQRFNYGGCEGNDNRFASEIECRHACVSIAAEECSMDLDSGPCNEYIPTWGFNKTVGLCQPFVYGGCEGNDNRFDTEDACDHKCGPKAVTMCHRSRNYAFYISQGNLGAFIPQCTLEGYFESMQCHGSTGYCWCVDMDGKEINGSRRAPGIHVQRPDCEALRPRMLTTCERHLKQVNGKDGRPPPGRYVPQCTEAGEYETIQCYGSTGYCWCVNENGEEVEGSRRGPGMGGPNCHGGPQGPCPTLVSNMQSGLANSGFNPQCTPDGLFVRVQCDGVAQCLCVNETTGDILKVLNEVPQDGDFDACNDAHGDLTPCQLHRNSVLSEEELDGHIRYVPECTESGDYKQTQCYGDTGHCWCVNDVGEEIDGTRKTPGQGPPDCTAKGCQTIRDERLSSRLIGAFIPDCTEEGLYQPTQCHGSTGHCWCVNEKGEEILETRRGPGQERIDCEAKGCQTIRDERLSSRLIGAFIPNCTEEGLYQPTQCHGSTGHCWCVNEKGEEILETRRGPGQERIDCEFKGCQTIRDEGLSSRLIGAFIPDCTEEGLYQPTQCHGSTGHCWCVNEKGEEILETRQGPGQERIDCEAKGCQTIRDERLSSRLIGAFIPNCTEEGLYHSTQCHGSTGHCWCVNEKGEEILETRRGPGQERIDCEFKGCQTIRDEGLSSRLIGAFIPDCTEEGLYQPTQCHGSTGHCWCVNEKGEEILETRRGPGQERIDCEAKGCQTIRDERLSSRLIGAFIPDCTEEGLYQPTQCHGSTGHCWCVNEKGEEILETRRGPGQERIDCEDSCSLPKVTGPCRGFFRSYVKGCQTIRDERLSSRLIGAFIPDCTEEGLYQPTQCHGSTGHCWCVNGKGEEILETRRGPGQERIDCEGYQPMTPTVSPSPAAITSTATRSTDKATTDAPAVQSTTQASSSTRKSEPSRPSATTSSPSTTPSTATISVTSASRSESSTESTTTVRSTTAEQSTTQESTTHHSSMCEIHHQEALANTLPGVFIPQCAEDGSFLPRQCYGLLGLCWCVHEDGTEQGGTRVGINEPLDCMDVCSMPEFRGQCPDNIDMWFFNAEAGVCEMFVYSGCQGNQNQFDSQEACENRCITPAPTSCVEKREMALSSGNLGEFVPQCTEDGQFTSQQCHGSIGHCWCVDDQGMELGATRRGPGEELLDCEDVCRLPKYSGPCRGNFALWYYDVMDERCKSFVYGGCQGNGNRFETLEECEQTCYVPEFTGRPPTPCEIKRDETLSTLHLHLFVPDCTAEGAYTSRQCYDLIGQCWCVNEEGETQGGTKTRDGQVPFNCNDKCSFPKFTGHCNANLDRWFYNMETGSCEEFVYGGCRGNMNNFQSLEECETSCIPNGHEMQSCKMQKELALSSNLPGVFIPQCTEDGWFAPTQCHDSTGQCWCVTESGMEQGDTRREPGMELLDCYDVCSFPKSSGPCLAYFAMWYYDTEEQQCRQFIYGGCQGNGNRFQTQEECEQSCAAQVSTTIEPASLCEVTRSEAQSQGLLGSFIPQCTEEGLFSRLQCHGSTGYCWCVDELTGEEIGNSAAAERFARPDCDAYYQFDSIPYVVEPYPSDPTIDITLNLSPALGDEGCATTPFGCCPDGVTQATRDDQFGCPGIAPPMVEVAPSDSTVVLGDTLTITCNSQGNPTPTTTWHRYDTNVEYLQDPRISLTGEGTLTIDGVTEDDAGPYVCRASNGVGQAAKVAVDVKVFTPVEIPETSQHSLKVKEGDLVLLFCHAVGNPKPTVTWMRNAELLPGNDPRMTQQEDDTLRIENVDLGDAGNYICTGRNMFGTVQKRTVTLIVQAKVQIVTRPEDIAASMGETITLPCTSIGSPKPTIIWRVNMIDLPSKDRFETSPNGDLTIRDLKSTDAGQYTCTAANGESVETAGATVTVIGANSDPNCQDNSDYANCRLVLKAGMCNTPPFTKYCCATCRDNNHAKRRRRRRR